MKKIFKEKITEKEKLINLEYWRNPVNLFVGVVIMGMICVGIVEIFKTNALGARLSLTLIIGGIAFICVNQFRITENPRTILEITEDTIKYKRWGVRKKYFDLDEIEKLWLITFEQDRIYDNLNNPEQCDILICINNGKELKLETLYVSRCRDSTQIYISIKLEVIKRGKQRLNIKLDDYVDYMLATENLAEVASGKRRNGIRSQHSRVIF